MRDLRFDKKRADSEQNRLSIVVPYIKKEYADFFTSFSAFFYSIFNRK